MMALMRLIVALITLINLDGGTGTGVAIFQFSGELVLAIAKIQIANGV